MKRSGFTLVELVTVIVIMGILIAISVPRITQYRAQAMQLQTEAGMATVSDTIIDVLNNIPPDTPYTIINEVTDLNQGAHMNSVPRAGVYYKTDDIAAIVNERLNGKAYVATRQDMALKVVGHRSPTTYSLQFTTYNDYYLTKESVSYINADSIADNGLWLIHVDINYGIGSNWKRHAYRDGVYQFTI